MLHFPSNLKLIRLLSGQTQPEFGALFNATKAMMVSYERGKASPDELFMARLSKYAGVSQHDLLHKALSEEDLQLGKVEKVDKASNQGTKKPAPEGEGFKDKYISALEKLVEKQESLLVSVQTQLTEVERKLSEIKHNQRISYSFQLAFQEYWVEHFQSDSGNLAAAEAKIGQIAFSRMKKLQEEGTLL